MMEMSAKVCGDKTVNGQTRAYWMRQASGKSGADTRTVSAETKVRELLNDAIKRIQKAEEFECSIDLDDLTTGLANLAKTIG
jgi:EAL domain-containing protein (putative c-di-GMP-specific phosphodiesterase class I)